MPSFSAQKGNFLHPAAKEGIAILFTDTSPRGAGIEGEDDESDFGTGVTHTYYSETCTQFHVLSRIPRSWLLFRRHKSKVSPPLQHAHTYPT